MRSVLITPDKGCLISGYSNSVISGDKDHNGYGGYDYWVIKLDSLQNIQWQKTYGGSGDDYLYSVANTTNGGFILGGRSNSDTSIIKTDNCLGKYDFWILKLNSGGEIEWQNTIGGDKTEWLDCIIQTDDGGYLACGGTESYISTINSEYNTEDCLIVKLNNSGDIQWQKIYADNDLEEITSAEQTIDGGYILCGYVQAIVPSKGNEAGYGEFDTKVMKLNREGEIEWQKIIGGEIEEFNSKISKLGTEGYVVAMFSTSGKSGIKDDTCRGKSDYWILKLDLFGNIEWQRTFGGSLSDYFTSLKVLPNHNILLGGSSKSPVSGEKTLDSIGLYDYWLVVLSDKGDMLNQFVFGGNEDDMLWSIDSDDTGYLLGGNSLSNISGNKTDNSIGDSDFWLLKIEGKVTTNLLESVNENVKLYPNPTTGILYCNISNPPLHAIVSNLNGQYLKQCDILNQSAVIDINDLCSGIYFVNLISDKEVIRFKVIKK